MNIENLLKPRYKVIAGWPYMPKHAKVGELVADNFILKAANYPHLFKKLEWWEERKANEMPKYVMSLADKKGYVFIIEEWDMDMLIGWVDKKERSCCSLTAFKPEYGYFPATEKEYNDYINSKIATLAQEIGFINLDALKKLL